MSEATYFLGAVPEAQRVFEDVEVMVRILIGQVLRIQKVTYGKREMDEDRKKAIMEFRMPTCQKEMQSFLGAALFFKSFVPNYSKIAS